MGGIVVVDFIDMESNEHRNALYKKMTELMAEDRVKHNVLPLTKIWLNANNTSKSKSSYKD